MLMKPTKVIRQDAEISIGKLAATNQLEVPADPIPHACGGVKVFL